MQRSIVRVVSAWHIRNVSCAIPTVSIKHTHFLVIRSVTRIEAVVDVIRHVKIECAEGRDAEIHALVLQVSTQTEVNLWQTAAEHSLVVTVHDAVAIQILIEAVTYVGTILSSHSVVCIKLFLGTGNAFIDPAVELTNLLTKESSISSLYIRIGANAKRSHFVLQST